jgi:DNA-binding LytR/AlgR family response regulator
MGRTFSYIIVDDEEIGRLALEAQAAKFPFLRKIASCSHPLEAIELIGLFKPNIVFTDIEMPGLNGIQLIDKLAGAVEAPVFVTSHPEFALESFEVQAFDYLIKPFSAERFMKCAYRLREFFELKNKAFEFDKKQATDFIVIKQGYNKHKIPLDEMIYLEAMKDYVKIVTTTKNYLVLATLANIHNMLPAKQFVRIHRSYIVNSWKITEVATNKIHLPACQLPLGKLYKNSVTEML